MAKDYYGTLGVARDASTDEIKRAYRKLAREFHPDVNPDPTAHERFKEISTAYEVLSDDQKRQIVDLGGDPLSNGGGAGAGCDRLVRRLPGHHGRVLRRRRRWRDSGSPFAYARRRRRDPAVAARSLRDRVRRRSSDHRRYRGRLRDLPRRRHRRRYAHRARATRATGVARCRASSARSSAR